MHDKAAGNGPNGRASQRDEQVHAERTPSLLGRPHVAQYSKCHAVHGTGPEAGKQSGGDEQAFGVGEAADEVPNQEPDVCEVEDGVPAVDFGQGANDHRAKRGGQQVDRQGHGRLCG